MRVRVDHARCQGHARCFKLAPHIFELDEDGYNRMPPTEVDESQRDIVERAVLACPERAIIIEDDADEGDSRNAQSVRGG